MTSSTDNSRRLVDKAFSQCDAAFMHGVHSFHGGHQSDLLIEPEAIRQLRAAMRERLEELLGDDGGSDRWERDGDRVRRVGYYAGALAAFHAFGGSSKWIEERHVSAAMKHIKEHCQDPENPAVRWVYCP